MDLCRHHPRLRARTQEEYKAVDREVKRSIKKDKRVALHQPLYPPGELFLPFSPLTTCMAGQWTYSIPNPQGRTVKLTVLKRS